MRKNRMASGTLALAVRYCAMNGVTPSMDGTGSACGGWATGAFMRGGRVTDRSQRLKRDPPVLHKLRGAAIRRGRRLRERGAKPRLCPQL
ncbi:hypothetical protein GCM10009422_07700 [Brevundimonas kwangchunensis]|uniref:Uncharacterized protein n=1 Tax=Brevundimonas kwangchunensis TaxID=322163 RepID=A0ABN1GP69_9CAUL